MDDSDEYVLWAGNLHRDVTEELLYELMIQAGPLVYVKKPKDKNFAFINFKHKESVKFALKIFGGVCLFRQMLNLKFREAKGAGNTPQRGGREQLDRSAPERLDSGRRKRSRSRSPHRRQDRQRQDRWGDDQSQRRDNGRRVYMQEDPYNTPRYKSNRMIREEPWDFFD